MKKQFLYPLVILLTCTVSFSYAQEKADKYCMITIKREFGYRVSVDIGTQGLYSKDSSLINSLKTITSTKNDVDLLDNMSRLGWSLVSSQLFINTNKQVFYFRKRNE